MQDLAPQPLKLQLALVYSLWSIELQNRSSYFFTSFFESFNIQFNV